MRVMPDPQTIKYCHCIKTTIMIFCFSIILATTIAVSRNHDHPKDEVVSIGRIEIRRIRRGSVRIRCRIARRTRIIGKEEDGDE